jgi:4-carboxymuconolactone decarboxylase
MTRDERTAVTEDELYRRGFETRAKVLDPTYIDSMQQTPSPLLQEFMQYTIKGAWGGVWSRPGLELKFRSLLSVTALAILNRPHELRIHLRGALNLGWTVEELREVFIHLSPYAGSPVTLDGLMVLDELVGALAAEQAADDVVTTVHEAVDGHPTGA